MEFFLDIFPDLQVLTIIIIHRLSFNQTPSLPLEPFQKALLGHGATVPERFKC